MNVTATQKIPASVRELIDSSRYCHESVRQVSEFLPADDSELSEWIAEAIHERNPHLFTYLAVAGASLGRPFQAEHLEKGLSLFPGHALAEWFVLNAEGDAPLAVMRAAEGFAIALNILAMALLAVALICRDEREGVLPANFKPVVRHLARKKNTNPHVRVFMIDIAV